MSVSDDSSVQAGNLFAVNGLVAVITGGGSGLGAYMARALALNGASKVYIIGRREEMLKKTASSVSTNNIIPLVGDVTSKSSLQSCADKVKAEAGFVDVLVCNSGISGPDTLYKDAKQETLPLEQIAANMWKPSQEEVTQTYAVNITGVQFTVAAFLPLLDAANKQRPSNSNPETLKPRPQIITTSSIGGFSRKALTNFSYGPSKAAVIHYTKQLMAALIPHDIRVNSIAPGLYLSEMTQGAFDKIGKTETHNVEGTWPKSEVPATRTGDEQDIAGIMLWLCSRAGAYLNGQIVVSDGGRLGVVPGSY